MHNLRISTRFRTIFMPKEPVYSLSKESLTAKHFLWNHETFSKVKLCFWFLKMKLLYMIDIWLLCTQPSQVVAEGNGFENEIRFDESKVEQDASIGQRHKFFTWIQLNRSIYLPNQCIPNPFFKSDFNAPLTNSQFNTQLWFERLSLEIKKV